MYPAEHDVKEFEVADSSTIHTTLKGTKTSAQVPCQVNAFHMPPRETKRTREARVNGS